VPTSTTGFAGLTRTGPVQYIVDGSGLRGPDASEPRLITSFTEFERVYGGLDPMEVEGDERIPYLAHAARAFFMNGGSRLYVSRVFYTDDTSTDAGWGIATRPVPVNSAPATQATWRARWPGKFGEVLVTVKAVRGKNVGFVFPVVPGDLLRKDLWGRQAKGVRAGGIVEVLPAGTDPLPTGNEDLDRDKLRVVRVDPATGRQTFEDHTGTVQPLNTDDILQPVTLQVIVQAEDERLDVYNDLGGDPADRRYVGKILQKNRPEDEDAIVWLDYGGYDPQDLTNSGFQGAPGANGIDLVVALQGNATPRLGPGGDGKLPPADGDALSLEGTPADLDHPEVKATGLAALEEIEDIAIVTLPDGGTYPDELRCFLAAQALIRHAEAPKSYRIAIVDGLQNSSMTAIREFRGRFDTTYGALYHPWIEIFDPTERPAQGAPPRRLMLPPSGFVAGIYARSDVQRGVFKAPANEVVTGLTRFEANINKGRQDVLNPEGINALRFFHGRGNRVWGARTMSSDPEWKYVNVRRLFIFLEHSIDKSTQWAVFEPNNERLWANIRFTIEDFLLVQWKAGALLGTKPEEAYFVRCDRTTMTQNDLDNGRLICLIGVAPTKPAEFVIFRIGQWTADAKLS
jgi:Bacteriophage tail sheath protein